VGGMRAAYLQLLSLRSNYSQ